MNLDNSCKFRVLEYVVFLMTFWASFLRFGGHFESHFWLKNYQKRSLKIDRKRDPGRRGPRKLEDGHSVVVYDASGRTNQHPTSSIARDH